MFRLGKYTLLAGRSQVEVNHYCQAWQELNGEALPTREQYQAIDKKIDQILDRMEAKAPCPKKD